jgi:hypothetical protein
MALALFVVVALTTTGRAWTALVPTGWSAQDCCHGPCPDAPAGAQAGRPCSSLGTLGCGNQPVPVTTAEPLYAPSPVFALTSGVPGLLPPLTHFPSLSPTSESVTSLLVQHTILRL